MRGISGLLALATLHAQAPVAQMKSDLAAIQAKSQVTPQMKQELANSLMAMAEGAAKPSQASVQKLANDLTAALASQKISKRELTQLTNDFYKVLNSAGITASEFNAVVEDARTILTASGVTKSTVQMIVSDLQAIGAELRKNVSGASGGRPGSSKAAFRKKFPVK